MCFWCTFRLKCTKSLVVIDLLPIFTLILDFSFLWGSVVGYSDVGPRPPHTSSCATEEAFSENKVRFPNHPSPGWIVSAGVKYTCILKWSVSWRSICCAHTYPAGGRGILEQTYILETVSLFYHCMYEWISLYHCMSLNWLQYEKEI